MMRFLFIAAAAVTAVACALSVPGAMADAPSPASPYVVVYHHGVGSVDKATRALEQQYGFTATFIYGRALKGFAAGLSDAQLAALSSDPAVDYITPDTESAAVGMAPLAAGETVPVGIRRVGAATSSQVHAASGVNVAVLDTGIDLANSDLNAVSGVNCIKRTRPAQDDNGHGTHVAGIIAGANQGAAAVGVAPGTKLYSVKVLGSAGSGTLSQILCGINWVTANAAALNIKVVNMSIAGTGKNDNNCGKTNRDAEHQAICTSIASGLSYVVAAGNNKASLAGYIPAAYPEVLTVTAMSDSDGLPGGAGPVPSCTSGQKDDSYGTYSNYAVSTTDQVHTVAAPGTCVVSDRTGGGLITYYGTSQAAPHVAGAVALCINDGGVPGPCSGLTPAQTIAKVRGDATAAAAAGNGFAGDPSRPITGRYYGYLVTAGGY